MTSLSDIIVRSFECPRTPSIQMSTRGPEVMLEIVPKEDKVEVPLFALSKFTSAYRNNPSAEAYVTMLGCDGDIEAPYSSLNSNIRYFLYRSTERLNHISSDPKNSTSPSYYVTFGAIFDASMLPVFVCSWAMELNETGYFEWQYPIIRIDPEVFAYKDDSVKRYICNNVPQLAALRLRTNSGNTSEYIKVIVGDFPYYFSKTKVPDCTLSTEDLMQLVKDNISLLTQ